MARRRALRRVVLAVIAGAAGAGVATLALTCGWLTGPAPWREATGWSAVPEPLRSTAVEPWGADGGGAPPRIRWLGHSGFVLDWGGTRLLLDPNTSSWCTVSRRVLERPFDDAAITGVDGALLSHAHYDHFDVPTLGRLAREATIVVPRGAVRYLGRSLRRTARPLELDVGQRTTIGRLEVKAVPAAHNGNRLHPFASEERALGYVIRLGPDAIYFAGDTGARNDFAAIGESHRPRLAILPIGAFRPRAVMRPYHLNPEEAVAAALELGVETVIPCHFGTFRLSLDRPASALPRFARAAAKHGVRWIMPRLGRFRAGDGEG